MSKIGWPQQFEWIEKDSKNWPDWMKEAKRIECQSEKTESNKKESKPKKQKKK